MWTSATGANIPNNAETINASVFLGCLCLSDKALDTKILLGLSMSVRQKHLTQGIVRAVYVCHTKALDTRYC